MSGRPFDMQNNALRQPIDIKISTVVAISAVLHETDSTILAAALHDMTGGESDFFDNEFAIIDVGFLDQAQVAQIDWPELIRLLKGVNLNPAAVRNASPELNSHFASLGLSIDDSPKDRHVAAAEVQSHAEHAQALAQAHAEPELAEPELAEPALSTPEPAEPTPAAPASPEKVAPAAPVALGCHPDLPGCTCMTQEQGARARRPRSPCQGGRNQEIYR